MAFVGANRLLKFQLAQADFQFGFLDRIFFPLNVRSEACRVIMMTRPKPDRSRLDGQDQKQCGKRTTHEGHSARVSIISSHDAGSCLAAKPPVASVKLKLNLDDPESSMAHLRLLFLSKRSRDIWRKSW